MNVYIDESGDLGWILNQPFRLGGSSQFLTIAALIIPKTLSHLSKRITKSVYRNRKQATNKELKGHNLTRDERVKFATKVVGLIQREPEIKIVAITVKKKNVQAHIRDDANKLYNYMIRLALLDFIKMVPSVNFIPDPRSLKVASGNSLIDYLQIDLWFNQNSSTILNYIPVESKNSFNLQFIDFIANIVWNFHENNRADGYNILKKHLHLKSLFF